jgi:hypothetical protein
VRAKPLQPPAELPVAQLNLPASRAATSAKSIALLISAPRPKDATRQEQRSSRAYRRRAKINGSFNTPKNEQGKQSAVAKIRLAGFFKIF